METGDFIRTGVEMAGVEMARVVVPERLGQGKAEMIALGSHFSFTLGKAA